MDKAQTPIQGYYAPNNRGTIDLFPEYMEGLKDITGFSHLILIYYLHEDEKAELQPVPFLDKERRGVFATRSPHRPNHIGLTVVKLNGIKGNILDISGVDMLDGTPLLDIKPYVPQFDIKDNATSGWFQNASDKEKYKIVE